MGCWGWWHAARRTHEASCSCFPVRICHCPLKRAQDLLIPFPCFALLSWCTKAVVVRMHPVCVCPAGKAPGAPGTGRSPRSPSRWHREVVSRPLGGEPGVIGGGGKRSTAWCLTGQGGRGWRLGAEKTLAHMETGDRAWWRRLRPGWPSSFFSLGGCRWPGSVVGIMHASCHNRV